MSMGESLPYRSPIAKLVRFFCGSRDKWKAKCKEAKRENKSLKYRLAKMTESRNRWKAQARSSETSLEVAAAPIEGEAAKNRVGRRSRGVRRRAGSRGGRRRLARLGVVAAG